MKIKNTFQNLFIYRTKPSAYAKHKYATFRRFVVTKYKWITKKLGVGKTKYLYTPPEGALPERTEIFRKTDRLGKGAAGQVHKVEVGRGVFRAYKNAWDESPHIREGLQKEESILRKLNHPNIVTTYSDPKTTKVVLINEQELNSDLEKVTATDLDAEYVLVDEVTEETEPGIQMDLATCNLKEKIPQMTEKECLQYTREMLSAVQYLHKHNICHMDIKPDNILSMDGKAVLTDFDIAIQKKKKQGKIIVTQMNRDDVSCTLPYAAPELLEFKKRKPIPVATLETTGCDVWSLGCTIAEIFTGELLFPSSYEGKNHYMNNYKGYPYEKRLNEFLQVHQQKMGPNIAKLLRDMLQTDPAKRISGKQALAAFKKMYPAAAGKV